MEKAGGKRRVYFPPRHWYVGKIWVQVLSLLQTFILWPQTGLPKETPKRTASRDSSKDQPSRHCSAVPSIRSPLERLVGSWQAQDPRHLHTGHSRTTQCTGQDPRHSLLQHSLSPQPNTLELFPRQQTGRNVVLVMGALGWSSTHLGSIWKTHVIVSNTHGSLSSALASRGWWQEASTGCPNKSEATGAKEQ